MTTKLINVCFAVMLLPGAAFAHHSFAQFDRSKVVSLTGVVRVFQWSNPHSWVQLLVTNSQGITTEYSLEALSPNVLRRMGWKRSSLNAGERITATFNPTRDGTHGGNLVQVVGPDGKVVGGAP